MLSVGTQIAAQLAHRPEEFELGSGGESALKYLTLLARHCDRRHSGTRRSQPDTALRRRATEALAVLTLILFTDNNLHQMKSHNA